MHKPARPFFNISTSLRSGRLNLKPPGGPP